MINHPIPQFHWLRRDDKIPGPRTACGGDYRCCPCDSWVHSSAIVGSIAHERMTPSYLNVFESCRVWIISNILTLRLFVTIHGLPSRREVCIFFFFLFCLYICFWQLRKERKGRGYSEEPEGSRELRGNPFLPEEVSCRFIPKPPVPEVVGSEYVLLPSSLFRFL